MNRADRRAAARRARRCRHRWVSKTFTTNHPDGSFTATRETWCELGCGVGP